MTRKGIEIGSTKLLLEASRLKNAVFLLPVGGTARRNVAAQDWRDYQDIFTFYRAGAGSGGPCQCSKTRCSVDAIVLLLSLTSSAFRFVPTPVLGPKERLRVRSRYYHSQRADSSAACE